MRGTGSSTETVRATVEHPAELQTLSVTVLVPGVVKVTTGDELVALPALLAATKLERAGSGPPSPKPGAVSPTGVATIATMAIVATAVRG
jgi:hypothetical protein